MKLTESKLRSIILEELSRINEELSGERRERVARMVEKAVDYLGLPYQRNTAGNHSSGEIEFVNNSDSAGFFVREAGSDQIEIVGRGRGYREGGTKVVLTDVQTVADAIEDEPLAERRRR